MTNRHIISRSIPIPERNWIFRKEDSIFEEDNENGNDLAALLTATTKTMRTITSIILRQLTSAFLRYSRYSLLTHRQRSADLA